MTSETIQNPKAASQTTIQNAKGRLTRQYFFVFVVLLGGGLITSGVLELYFRYRESREQIAVVQGEIASSAAQRIAQFILTIEDHMKAATMSSVVAREGIGEKYQFELAKLLATTPPITDVFAIGAAGQVLAFASRFRVEPGADERDLSKAAGFLRAKQGITYFGPVSFVDDAEPTMTMAVPVERFPGNVIGALHAKVDLRQIWQVVRDLKFSDTGYAYVVTRSGDLIAHSNPGLALQRLRVPPLTQVQAAFQPNFIRPTPQTTTARSFTGQDVLSSFVFLPNLEWAVFVEQPVQEAYKNLYGSILRTSALFLLGFGVALIASVFVSRRVVRPLAILRASVERIGAGDLDHRIEVKTGNEIEMLADEFNKMSSALKQSYSSLEQKVTDRTRALQVANHRLQELDRLKSHFLSNVSHELRTPLTAIGSLVDNMLDGVTGTLNDKQSRYITGVKESGERLARLINDLLDLSVIESGRVKLEPSRFSVSDLVLQVAGTMTAVAQAKPVTLELPVGGGNHMAWADRDRISQVLTNLIGNAIKFTPMGGNVRVAIGPACDDDMLQISVRDTGPGIPEDERAQIFDEFYQISQPGEEKAKGIGLGLAISKKLVEMNGGKITVESNPGSGSTFTFTVPAYRENSTMAQLHGGARI